MDETACIRYSANVFVMVLIRSDSTSSSRGSVVISDGGLSIFTIKRYLLEDKSLYLDSFMVKYFKDTCQNHPYIGYV
jgi:hypothetical protein